MEIVNCDFLWLKEAVKHNRAVIFQMGIASIWIDATETFSFLGAILNSKTLESNLIVSGIQWLIHCPFFHETTFSPFLWLVISKSSFSLHIRLFNNDHCH